MAYFRIVGPPDPWLRTGTLAALLHNAWFKGRAKGAADFIPVRRVRPRQTAEEQMTIVEGIARRMQS